MFYLASSKHKVLDETNKQHHFFGKQKRKMVIFAFKRREAEKNDNVHCFISKQMT